MSQQPHPCRDRGEAGDTTEGGITIKTPEEIKKALNCCGGSGGCKECPYYIGVELCIGMITQDALSYIRQLENQVADLGKKVPKWISVKEQLPKDGQKVIASFRNEGGVIVDQARYSNGEFVNWAYVWRDNITHWMHMPEPPKEEHDEQQKDKAPRST